MRPEVKTLSLNNVGKAILKKLHDGVAASFEDDIHQVSMRRLVAMLGEDISVIHIVMYRLYRFESSRPSFSQSYAIRSCATSQPLLTASQRAPPAHRFATSTSMKMPCRYPLSLRALVLMSASPQAPSKTSSFHYQQFLDWGCLLRRSRWLTSIIGLMCIRSSRRSRGLPLRHS